ncbi:xylulose kinase-1 [Tanacetum coccineum]
MVAYLKKPEGSEGFHQIVDFLNSSHIRYALIENPTIYVSLIKQFWETATAKTLDNGRVELTATIDGKVKIVTEASGPIVQGERSTHLVESHHTPTSAPSTLQPLISPTFRRTNRQEFMVPRPRSPTQTRVAYEAASTCVDVRYGGATTTVIGLKAGQGSGNIDKTPTMPQDSPFPRKVESLETDLKQTKLTYGAAYTKLIKKVKKLENKVKSSQARKRARITVSDDEDDLEDPSKQGRKIVEIDQDPAISLVQHDAEIQGRHEHDMEVNFDLDAAKDAIVTTASVAVSIAKDKGKAKMDKSESENAQTNTELQQEQERLGYEAAVRLQAKLEEEERPRIARVYETASSFNVEEWEDIQARVEADEELAQRLQVKEREMYSEAEQVRMLVELINQRKRYFAVQRAEERKNKPPTQAQQRTYMSNYIKHMRGYTLQQLRGYSFDEIKNLFETTMRRTGESSEPAEEPKDKEEELSQEELQQMMIIVPEQGMNVEALQTKYLIIDWEIYTEGTRKYWKIITVGNHTEEYPLSRGTLTQMLVAKLLVEQDNEMSKELIRKICMQEEEAEAMAESMEQYMSKTRTNYGSGVARPKIEEKDSFELKGQFLKELRENTFNGSDNVDANEHIEKVLEIVDLFHVPNITKDQLMLRVFLISLTRATSHWLRNEPTGSIKTWEDLKTKFLNKYCPPGRTMKKMEEINNFQQEPDETLYQAWGHFKEFLMKCPQHYLTEMQEVILFYNRLDVPT